MDTSRIRKIRNRQQARFLDHLKKTGQLTPGLTKDVMRAYTYFEEDISKAVTGNDKEPHDGNKRSNTNHGTL